jgi:hypothetical protein
VKFARVVSVFGGAPTVVQTGLTEPSDFVAPVGTGPAPAPRKPVKQRQPLPPAVASLYTAAGVHLALGRQLTRGADTQPATKLLLPVETGVVVRPGKAWVRVAGSAAPLASGVLLYDDAYGDTASPVALGATVAGGLVAQQGDIGLLAGYLWPDRVPVRAVVAVRTPRFPFQVEGRLGMDLPLGATPEPAFELHFALTPGLFRRED